MIDLKAGKFTWISRPSEGMLFSARDLRKLIVPLVAEQFLSYLIGLADSLMVSSAGEAAVSAVSQVDAISVLFIMMFTALATGGAVVAGQYLGRGEPGRARASAEHLTVLLFVISVGITALLLLCRENVLRILFGKTDPAVLENCRTYYRIVMYSVPCIALYNGGAAIFRTTGNSRTPMLISLLMNAINIVGNAVLIFVFKMGVAGVAIPTLVSRALGMIIIFALTVRKSFSLNLRGLVRFRPDWHLIGNILSIGIPAGVENGMFQFGKLILVSLASSLPLSQITANAIGNVVANFQGFMAMGINMAQIPVISRCAGAGDYRQARWYVRHYVALTYIFQGIWSVLMCATIPLILKAYGVSAETWHYGVWIMLIHGIGMCTLWPVAFMLNTAMRAAGDSKYVMVIASVSMWLCRVGGSYLLIRGFGVSVIGIWVAWTVDWVFRIIFFVPRYVGHKWETKAIAS